MPGGWPPPGPRFMRWLVELKGHKRTKVSVSGLNLEEALELEGHHLAAVAGVQGEGHPVAGGLGQNAGGGRLAELGPSELGAPLGGQQRVEVGHRTLPVLVVASGEAHRRALLLCRRGLPRLRGAGKGSVLVTAAVAVIVKASYDARGGCHGSGDCHALVPPTLLVLLWQRALGVRHWNVVPLSSSHGYQNGRHLRRKHHPLVHWVGCNYCSFNTCLSPWVERNNSQIVR